MPKRGTLKSAGKRQESATFLQRSFFNVALQFFARCSAAFGQNDIRTADKPMFQCNVCSAAFRKRQRNFRLLSGPQKGPAERGHVKKRQKSSKSVKNILVASRHFSRRAKNVKKLSKSVKIFSTFFDNSRAAPVCRPLLGGSDFRLWYVAGVGFRGVGFRTC